MKKQEIPGVKPIKNVLHLRKWGKYIEEHCSPKLYTYFVIGLDVGLSPTFLCALKWEDIKTEQSGGAIPFVTTYLLIPSKIQEEPRKIIFSPVSVTALNKLRERCPADIYVFQSESPNSKKNAKPVTLRSLGVQLRDSAEKSGIPLPGAVGALTLRKSFGYHHIVHGTWTLHEVMRYFEQRSFQFTRNYIDLTNEKINETRLPRKPRKS